MDDGSTPTPVTSRRARLARRLGTISLWAVFVAVAVFALVFGLEPWVIFVALFGVVLAAVNRVLSKRVEELLDRKPELRLVISDNDDFVETIAAKAPPPWPFDADRVIAHEVNRLHEEAQAGEKFARRPGFATLYTDPFAIKPRAEEYERAREKFAAKVDEHEGALRAWLEGYRQTAGERARTFELSLWIISAKSGAYAEDVVLAIDLPVGVEIVEAWPTVSPPPEPPQYVAPQPRSATDLARLRYPGVNLPPLASLMPTAADVPRVSLWQTRSDGRRVSMSLGSIHHDVNVDLGERLMLRVPAPGRHTLTWTLRSKNGRRHCTGTLELVVPAAGERRPFGRLEGIARYPDVPFVDDDGEVATAARTSDPPAEPPAAPDADDLLNRLTQMGAYNEWLALGLGDDADDADEVRIERVAPVDAEPGREDDAA